MILIGAPFDSRCIITGETKKTIIFDINFFNCSSFLKKNLIGGNNFNWRFLIECTCFGTAEKKTNLYRGVPIRTTLSPGQCYLPHEKNWPSCSCIFVHKFNLFLRRIFSNQNRKG